MRITQTYAFVVLILLSACGSEKPGEQDKQTQTNQDTSSVTIDETDNSNNSTEEETKDEKPQKTKTEYQYILGKWNGTLRDKKLTIVIESIQGNDVVGYNIAGKNKRPLTGKISADDRNGDGECMGNMIVYKLLLNEPGDDKWDGTYTLYFGDCPEFDEETDKILSHSYNVYGSWRAFSGKLSGDVYLTK